VVCFDYCGYGGFFVFLGFYFFDDFGYDVVCLFDDLGF